MAFEQIGRVNRVFQGESSDQVEKPSGSIAGHGLARVADQAEAGGVGQNGDVVGNGDPAGGDGIARWLG